MTSMATSGGYVFAVENGSALLDTNMTLSDSWESFDNRGEEPTHLATAIGATVMLLFWVEGMIGNLWILGAIIVHRKLWNVINIFIVSLCLNDLLTLCMIVIFIIDSYIWQEWTAGMTMCKLTPEFTVAFTGCSLWHTAFIAIHRYIVVVHNTKYKRMSKRAYIIFVLFATRAIPTACTIPGFSLNTSGYVEKLLRCILLPSEKARMITITLVQIILPCIVVLVCYALIFAFVLYAGYQVHNTNLLLQREIQITKMFGVIFLMILVGFVPYGVIRNMDRNNAFSGDVYVVVTVFYGIATCSNPLVYGAMSTEVRRACIACFNELLAFLHCRCPCTKPPIQSDVDMTTYGVTESRTPTSGAQNCHLKVPLNGSLPEEPEEPAEA